VHPIAALAVHPHVHADEIVVESDSGDAVLGGPGYGRRRAATHRCERVGYTSAPGVTEVSFRTERSR